MEDPEFNNSPALRSRFWTKFAEFITGANLPVAPFGAAVRVAQLSLIGLVIVIALAWINR